MGFMWKILVLVAVASFFSASADPTDDDRDALIALKENLEDPLNVFETWDNSTSACEWFHIVCDGDRVSRLVLGFAELSGGLVPELGNLDQLQYLWLNNNNITGNIPKELGNLVKLVTLELDDNSLTGEIPESLGNLQSLQLLLLNDNKLTGKIPQAVSSLPNLQIANFTGNDLTPPGLF